jgi:glycolate oxidase
MGNKPIQEKLRSELTRIIAPDRVLHKKRDIAVYKYDSTPFQNEPVLIILPETTEEVAAVIKFAAQNNIPITPRGAGTSLSGGPIPSPGGISMPLTRMDKILKIDLENKLAIVQPGVTNKQLQDALAVHGYWFPPDPASFSVATLGGNVAENAGGPHCLKYGVTSNHVMGLEMVLANEEVLTLGSPLEDPPGYDLTGIMVGSEGTMGIITQIIVRISQRPQATSTILAIFGSTWDAATSVFEMIRNGLNPSVLEMLEERMLQEVNTVFNLGYPDSAKALLIIEVDGRPEGLSYELEGIVEVCRKNQVQILEVAQTEEERDRLWKARRGGTPALGRLKPDSGENDVVVPRSKLPEMIEKLKEISDRNQVILGGLFHAGDGNCHPQIPFDARIPGEHEAAEQALWEIFEAAVSLGGTISGEHGVGLEKIRGLPLVFSREEMELMVKVKRVFDRKNLLNPDKIFPADVRGDVEGGNV